MPDTFTGALFCINMFAFKLFGQTVKKYSDPIISNLKKDRPLSSLYH